MTLRLFPKLDEVYARIQMNDMQANEIIPMPMYMYVLNSKLSNKHCHKC